MKTGWKKKRVVNISTVIDFQATYAGCDMPANWQLVQACEAHHVV
jgi:hypothetical protein